MRILANENCPRQLVTRLREMGHDVAWVREVLPGARDEVVIARARDEDRVLLTFDKDFGEIAYRSGVSTPSGIILLRLPTTSPDSIAEAVTTTLQSSPGWEGAFSVVEESRIRRRPLP